MTLDNIGDIYLIGRMALDVVNADEIDQVLGQVLGRQQRLQHPARTRLRDLDPQVSGPGRWRAGSPPEETSRPSST